MGYGGNGGTFAGHSRSVLPPTIKLFARNLMLWSNRRTKFFYITPDDTTFGPDLQALLKLCEQGKIQPLIKCVHDLSDIQAAHLSWGKAPGIGSMLIKVSQENE